MEVGPTPLHVARSVSFEFADRSWSATQRLDDDPPTGIGQRVEDAIDLAAGTIIEHPNYTFIPRQLLGGTMSKLRCHISISADGFVAGPNQSAENPLGEGGERLHDWVATLAAWREHHGMQGGEVNESTRVMEETAENIGAGVMGRNMFSPPRGGAWSDEEWKGWWGDDPPYHSDVFILTHHPRDPIEMEGGTTYHFVTDGIERALERARESAGGKDVRLWGGAQVIQQYLAAGLLDDLELHIVPVLLGDGARLFDNLGDAKPRLEQVRAVEAPGVTHLKYRVVT
jgi:dihydrofolate reductase